MIDHIAVLVENLDISQKWYEKHCGAKLIFEDHKYKRMSMGNISIALIDKKHYEHAHFAILVENKQDLPTNKGKVVKHRDGTVGVYVKDPFGNYLEYIWYSDKQKKVFLND